MRSEHPSPVRAGAGPLQPRSLLDTVSTGGPADAGPRGWNPHRLGHRARDGTESVDRPFANPERSSGHDAGADGGGQVREAGAGAGRADLHAASNMRRASGSSCAAPCTKSSIRVSFPRPSPARGAVLVRHPVLRGPGHDPPRRRFAPGLRERQGRTRAAGAADRRLLPQIDTDDDHGPTWGDCDTIHRSCATSPRGRALAARPGPCSSADSRAPSGGFELDAPAVDLELQVQVRPVVDRPAVSQPQECFGLSL